jgi:hypothetical protein
MILFAMSEDNVARGLRQPWVMIGSDGEGRAAEGAYASGKPQLSWSETPSAWTGSSS